jgi:hypothetical protein
VREMQSVLFVYIDGAFGGPDYLPSCISFNQRDVAIDQGKKVVVTPWDTGSPTAHPLRFAPRGTLTPLPE